MKYEVSEKLKMTLSLLLKKLDEMEDTIQLEDSIAENLDSVVKDPDFFKLPITVVYRIVSFAGAISFNTAKILMEGAAQAYGSGACMFLQNLELKEGKPSEYVQLISMIRNSKACSIISSLQVIQNTATIPYDDSKYTREIASLKNRIERMKKASKEAELLKENADLKKEIDDLREKVQNSFSQQDVKDLEEENSVLKSMIEDMQKDINNLKGEISRKAKQEEENAGSVAEYNNMKEMLEQSNEEKEKMKVEMERLRKLVDELVPKEEVKQNEENFISVFVKKDMSLIRAFLAKKPESINDLDEGGETALIIACKEKNFEMVDFLVRNGADVNCKNKKGIPLLMQTIESGDLRIANLLIENGVDVKVRGLLNKTPLIIAAKLGDAELVKKLIASGAELNVIDKNNESALSAARNVEVRKILQDNGAK